MARTKNKKSQQPVLADFVKKVAAKTKASKYVLNPKGEINMSDAISQIIEPYRDDAPDYKSLYTLVTFACAAWNASILPPEQRDELLGKLLNTISKDRDRFDASGILQELMARKKKLFPDVSRMIVEFKVTDRGNDFHIAVASTLGQ